MIGNRIEGMTLEEFGQRFLNYKALVRIVNNHTGVTEFAGMFMDCPYRYLRFADVVRVELDKATKVLVFYITSNSGMFFAKESKFMIDAPAAIIL